MLLIDIIIPVLNEEAILTKEADYYRNLKNRGRVIFVDGGSTDHTVAIAQQYGEVFSSPAGRGLQKNRGAQESKAEYLLFLHVDSFIAQDALDQIDRAMNEGAVGGCLTMHIQDKQSVFRLYEQVVNLRARIFGVIDGDLGMFVRGDVFNQLGGFDLLHVMEDLTFARKLRKRGPICVLQDPIHVSSRKWHHQGFGKTFWQYTKAYIQLWTGSLKVDHKLDHQASSSV